MYVTRYGTRLHLLLNFIFWIGMYLFWLGFNSPAMPSLAVNILFTFVDFLCFTLIAFLTGYILIPRFLYRKNYFRFGLSYLLLLIIITSIMVFCNFLILRPYRPVGQDFSFSFNLTDLAGSYLLAFFLSSASCIFKLVDDFYTSQSALVQLKEEKTKTELEFLRLQVSPHSFFNILNTIYFQIDLDKESAKSSVLQFSNMFRYQLYECETETVPVRKEINFLTSYIAISKTRFDSDYTIDFNLSEEGNPCIAPFLLFPLVENAFKYVSQYPDKGNMITISISYNAHCLECIITNTAEEPAGGKGIGLKNLKRRLDLLYRDKHSYLSSYHDGLFQTQLQLTL
jgi:two-component system, LytTR family, sensor kinase